MPPMLVKRCACGADYTSVSWNTLKLVSAQWPGAEWPSDDPLLELRNCQQCGSTIAIEIKQGKTD